MIFSLEQNRIEKEQKSFCSRSICAYSEVFLFRSIPVRRKSGSGKPP